MINLILIILHFVEKEINDSRITLHKDERGVENAKLVIEKVELEDRALYTCIGTNPITIFSHKDAISTTQVRVKGKRKQKL